MNCIINTDCIQAMKDLKNDSVDVFFADPPFNLNKKYNSHKDNMSDDDYLSWCEAWINEGIRTLKPSGSLFIHNIPKWLLMYSGFLQGKLKFRHWISWNAPTAPMGKTLQPNHYGILFFCKDVKKNKFFEIRHPHDRCRKCNVLLKDYGGKKEGLHPFGPLVSDVWSDINRLKHKRNRDKHPCQLPVHLMERIILMSSDDGDTILDPFLGTGTTAIASKKLGRKYIGIELDKEYFDIAQEKLKEETEKSKIGNIYVSKYLNKIRTIRDKDWDELKNSFEEFQNKKEIEYNNLKFKKKV